MCELGHADSFAEHMYVLLAWTIVAAAEPCLESCCRQLKHACLWYRHLHVPVFTLSCILLRKGQPLQVAP